MYGYIYKTTNLINEKIYIGQHKGKTIDNKYFGSGILIKRSLKKYGKENFKCELIDNADNKSDLDSKEIYWIEKLDSRNIEIGYNIVSGGNGGNLISITTHLHPTTLEKEMQLIWQSLPKIGCLCI